MVDFSAALARKYDILQQEANAKSMAAAAGAYLDRTRANVLPGQAAAENFERAARGRQYNVESNLMPGRAESEIGLNRSRAGNIDADTRYRDVMTRKELGVLAPNPYFSEVLGGGASGGRGSQVTDRSAELGLPPIGMPSRSSVDMSASSAPRATAPRYSAPKPVLRDGPMITEEVSGARSTGGMRYVTPRQRDMVASRPTAPLPPKRPTSFGGDTALSGPAPMMTGRFGGMPPIGMGSALQFNAGLRPPTWLEQQGIGMNSSPSENFSTGLGRSVDDYEREMAGRTSRPLLGLF